MFTIPKMDRIWQF